jgi:hypothetical protein
MKAVLKLWVFEQFPRDVWIFIAKPVIFYNRTFSKILPGFEKSA